VDHHLLPQRFDLEEVHTAMNVRAIGMWMVAGVLGSILVVQAASVTLAWDPPNPSTEVTGYKLYYGPADTQGAEWYTEVVDVHKVTQYTLEELTAGTWYVFAVQAYGDDGKTSDFSNKVRHLVGGTEPLSSSLRVVAVDSEETEFESRAGRNVLDGDPTTFWHTKWFGQDPPHPHYIILDLGAVRTVYGLRYLPRQDGDLNGTIVGYEVYVSLDRDAWTPTPWMSGSWEATADEKIAVLSRGQQGRYLKLVATSAANNRPWTSAAEIQIIGGLQ
jgi:phospholipase C